MSAFFLVVFPHPPNIASGLGGHYYFLSNSFKLNLDLFTSICKRGCRSPRFPWNCTTFCFAFLIAANVRDFPRAAAFFFNCFRFDVAFVKSTISGLRENLNTKEVNTIHFIVLHPGLSDVVLWNWANLKMSFCASPKQEGMLASFNLLCILFITILHIVLWPQKPREPIMQRTSACCIQIRLWKIYCIELHMFASNLSTHC